ncbi:type II toxin-antitoxin system YafQ family toxin [Yersinia alsatica]|uniref:type II toxin-antitoxin system YafQ family toxin n=2 Tax=Yersinia alsatica TaxID=2890317 RepID=UPI001E2C29B9|nr:type II toxin-antitoxin system YafQ family toxin [Yersinia alsatica]
MKKATVSKRTTMPRTADYTKDFLKDWEKLSRSGRYDMHRLKQAMLLLIANDMPLGAEWLDHSLKGDWQDFRECHVGGDFLLIYKLSNHSKTSQIVFVRTGTHAELFE